MEQLTPIDEEPSEDDNNDEDQPITMIPKIMHTAPSPTTDNPPTSNLTLTTTVNNEQTPKHDLASKLPATATAIATTIEPTISEEVTIEEENEQKQTIPNEHTTKNGSIDKEVSQIESVL